MLSFRCQVVVCGAGIAGLWTLRRLRAAGYDAVLLERDAVGCGQTLAAQGILHGGVKYGLDGSDRKIAEMLAALPPVWEASMAGQAEPSLAGARILSKCQHLWAADSWLAKVGATVGARAMRGEVRKLESEEWPTALREGGHRGAVHELAETVVEVRSVLEALAAPERARIFHGMVTGAEHNGSGGLRALTLHCADGTMARAEADAFVFTAATGNEAAAEFLGLGREATQRRPLKQVMARGALLPLYGHCVTVSPKPIVTITTHPLENGESVWYLGGGVAEDGARMDDREAITNAREKLRTIFPRMDWSAVSWSTWSVDRAEPSAASRLPDGPALMIRGNAALAWPTKLVYAPALADKALAFVAERIAPPRAVAPLPALPSPPTGLYPWEAVSSWSELPS